MQEGSITDPCTDVQRFLPACLHASVLHAASPRSCSFTRQARVTSLVDRFVDSFRPAGYQLALAYDDALRSRLCGFRLSHHVMSRVLSHYIDL